MRAIVVHLTLLGFLLGFSGCATGGNSASPREFAKSTATKKIDRSLASQSAANPALIALMNAGAVQIEFSSKLASQPISEADQKKIRAMGIAAYFANVVDVTQHTEEVRFSREMTDLAVRCGSYDEKKGQPCTVRIGSVSIPYEAEKFELSSIPESVVVIDLTWKTNSAGVPGVVAPVTVEQFLLE